MNDTTTTERQRRRRTILESEVKGVAKQVVRELGADASLWTSRRPPASGWGCSLAKRSFTRYTNTVRPCDDVSGDVSDAGDSGRRATRRPTVGHSW